jgi:hypothetical protein
LSFLVVVTLHQRLRDQLEDLRHQRNVMRRLIARLERRWDRLPIWKPEAAPNDKRLSTAIRNNHKTERRTLKRFPTTWMCSAKARCFNSYRLRRPALVCERLRKWIIGPAVASDAKLRSEAADSLPVSVLFATNSTISRDVHRRRHPTPIIFCAGSQPLRGFLATVDDGVGMRLPVAVDRPRRSFSSCLMTKRTQRPLDCARHRGGINALISTFLLGEVHEIFASALAGRGHVEGYRQMFELSGELPESSPMLARIRHELVKSDNNAAKAMVELKRIAAATSIKHVACCFPFICCFKCSGFGNCTCCDIWSVGRIAIAPSPQAGSRRWANLKPLRQSQHSRTSIQSGLVLPGQIPIPQAKVVAKQLGHPLINDSVRVSNDIVIGPTGTLLLVTGSNMSGKSTMLRSVGLNVLLAGAGAPVCAEACRCLRSNLRPAFVFATTWAKVSRSTWLNCIRWRASSSMQNAWLIAQRGNRQNALLFLLDEILQGTNSRERQIAVAHVLRHLVKCEAIGAITTHDLELADDPQLKAMAHTVHFRETITVTADGEDTMTFDYRMREGVSPTTNALRLLEVVGWESLNWRIKSCSEIKSTAVKIVPRWRSRGSVRYNVTPLITGPKISRICFLDGQEKVR